MTMIKSTENFPKITDAIKFIAKKGLTDCKLSRTKGRWTVEYKEDPFLAMLKEYCMRDVEMTLSYFFNLGAIEGEFEVITDQQVAPTHDIEPYELLAGVSFK